MQQTLGDLQDAFTELNINIPSTEEEQEYLLPQWKDITSFLDRATEGLKNYSLIKYNTDYFHYNLMWVN
ncbi:unnamed protein product [Mucor hiemalis]